MKTLHDSLGETGSLLAGFLYDVVKKPYPFSGSQEFENEFDELLQKAIKDAGVYTAEDEKELTNINNKLKNLLEKDKNRFSPALLREYFSQKDVEQEDVLVKFTNAFLDLSKISEEFKDPHKASVYGKQIAETFFKSCDFNLFHYSVLGNYFWKEYVKEKLNEIGPKISSIQRIGKIEEGGKASGVEIHFHLPEKYDEIVNKLDHFYKKDLEINIKQIRTTYFNTLKSQIEYITKIGIAYRDGSYYHPLRDVYVEPILKSGSRQEEWKGSFDEALVQSHCMVLLGKAGVGKSTAVQYYVWKNIEAKNLPYQVQHLLPIRISIREYINNPRQSFIDHLVDNLSNFGARGIDSEYFYLHLLQGKCIVFFDGLDEVPSIDLRENIKNKIVAFIRNNPGNRIIVTSRPEGYTSTPLPEGSGSDDVVFERYYIEGFDPDKQKEYLSKWYDVGAEVNKVEISQETFVETLMEGLKEFQELARVPLLLKMITLVFAHNPYNELPTSKVELYELTVDTYLRDWINTKKYKDIFPEHLAYEVDVVTLRRILAFLAYNMFSGEEIEGNTLIKKDQIIPQDYLQIAKEEARSKIIALLKTGRLDIPRSIRPEDFVEPFIEYAKDHASVILVGQGGKHFEFIHKSFQEYFIAEFLLTEKELHGRDDLWEDIVVKYVDKDDWNEVLDILVVKLTENERNALNTKFAQHIHYDSSKAEKKIVSVLRWLDLGAKGLGHAGVDHLFSQLVLNQLQMIETKSQTTVFRNTVQSNWFNNVAIEGLRSFKEQFEQLIQKNEIPDVYVHLYQWIDEIKQEIENEDFIKILDELVELWQAHFLEQSKTPSFYYHIKNDKLINEDESKELSNPQIYALRTETIYNYHRELHYLCLRLKNQTPRSKHFYKQFDYLSNFKKRINYFIKIREIIGPKNSDLKATDCIACVLSFLQDRKYPIGVKELEDGIDWLKYELYGLSSTLYIYTLSSNVFENIDSANPVSKRYSHDFFRTIFLSESYDKLFEIIGFKEIFWGNYSPPSSERDSIAERIRLIEKSEGFLPVFELPHLIFNQIDKIDSHFQTIHELSIDEYELLELYAYLFSISPLFLLVVFSPQSPYLKVIHRTILQSILVVHNPTLGLPLTLEPENVLLTPKDSETYEFALRLRSAFPDFIIEEPDTTTSEVGPKIDERKISVTQQIGELGEYAKVTGVELSIQYPYFQERPTDLSRSFDNLIQERTKNFVGREFVFKALDAFLTDENQESGYFIIKGEPGIGKSTLMAHLVKERGYIHHFNTALQAINKPRQFLRSVCAQLIARFDLDYPIWPSDAEKDGAFLYQLLVECSEKLQQGKRLVIAVDALDESDISDLPSQVNVLYLSPNLPPNVFFVVTTRPKHDIRLDVLHSRVLELEAESEHNLRDARMYIASFLPDEQMQQRLRDWNVTPEQFIDKILEKSEGNFMYLQHVLSAIKAGRFVEGRLYELPEGLLGYYRSHWRQMRNRDEETFETYYQPVVCVLAAVKEAVSVEQLEAYTGLKLNRIRNVLREWQEFLYKEINDQNQHLYKVYHSSFEEFLKDEVDPGLKTYHRMIANYYLRFAGKGGS